MPDDDFRKAASREARRACRFFGRWLLEASAARGEPHSFAAATDGEVVFVIARGRYAKRLTSTVNRWGGYGLDKVPPVKR